MTWREFLAGLRRASRSSEKRAAILLRLGSERPEDAIPRAGFEARLRALLDDAAVEAPSWARELDPLVRPALALGTIVVALCIGVYASSAAPPPDPVDLASLFEADPVFSSLLGTPEAR